MWWLLPPWGARARRREALAAVRGWQDFERRRAYAQFPGVARILDDPTLNRGDRWDVR